MQQNSYKVLTLNRDMLKSDTEWLQAHTGFLNGQWTLSKSTMGIYEVSAEWPPVHIGSFQKATGIRWISE